MVGEGHFAFNDSEEFPNFFTATSSGFDYALFFFLNPGGVFEFGLSVIAEVGSYLCRRLPDGDISKHGAQNTPKKFDF